MIMTLKLDASLKKNDMMSWMSFKIYQKKKHKTSTEKMIKFYQDIKENLNKWKHIPCLQTVSLTLSRGQFSPN